MSNRPRSFTQADVTRAVKGAIKGAQALGLEVARVEFEPYSGKVVVVPEKTDNTLQNKNDWDGA